MKALSIRQPWAWAIFHTGKEVENRDWSERYQGMRDAQRIVASREKILIHASSGMTRVEYEDFVDTAHEIFKRLPRGDALVLPDRSALDFGGFVGTAMIAGIIRKGDMTTLPSVLATIAQSSPWFFGPVGLVLAQREPCRFTPFKGALGFFDVPDEIVREAMQ